MKTLFANPWAALPKRSPYVLPNDAPYVHAFNQTASEDQRIELDALPEPFFGSFEAPVVILLQNPGLSPRDLRHHKRPDFSAALRSNLIARQRLDHFHLLDATHGPGHDWWHRCCRELILEVGLDQLASKLLTLDFSPYHSKRFGHAHLRLPSQAFTFDLLRRAIQRRAWVVRARGYKAWVGAVPELASYTRVLKTNSPRSVALSPGNLEHYQALVTAVGCDA